MWEHLERAFGDPLIVVRPSENSSAHQVSEFEVLKLPVVVLVTFPEKLRHRQFLLTFDPPVAAWIATLGSG